MAKSEDEKLADRLAEIEKLVKQRAEIDVRLKELTGIRTREKENLQPKPEGFVLMDAIQFVLQEAGKPLKVREIVEKIERRYGYTAEDTTLRATAKYMATKKGILEYNTDIKTFSLALGA